MTIPHHEMLDRTPAWSPDGQMLAFMSVRSGNGDIWVVPTEGGEARQLTNHQGEDWWPMWSHEGNWVYFSSARSGRYRLWRVPAEGGEPEQVTERGGLISGKSMDGRRIFLLQGRSIIWAYTLEDRTERNLTDLEGRPGGMFETLGTDGEHLYFSWGMNVSDLWVTDVVRE